MATKVTVKNEAITTGLNIAQRFANLGLSTDSVIARIEGVLKSVSDNGTWFSMVMQVLVNGKFETFPTKLNAGTGNADYIKQCEDFFANFQKGDYQVTNLNIRVKGETWESEDGKSKGTYGASYINIPFTSDMLFMGETAVLTMKQQEAEYRKLLLQQAAEKPE
jgi:hypothetical protein